MSVLVEVFKDLLFRRKTESNPRVDRTRNEGHEYSVLNVGGGSKATPIPAHYSGWRHDLLDIDARGEPDIVCDARELSSMSEGLYDAIYCSHNLEHYYRHDGLRVVQGFVHILNERGFAEIRVPNIAQVILEVVEKNLDLDDVLYHSAAGPITAHDVIYGLQTEIVESGQDFYAHKTGFTPKSLTELLIQGGFHEVYLVNDEHLAITAFAFKASPTKTQIENLGKYLGVGA
jgi:hypothetical protein